MDERRFRDGEGLSMEEFRYVVFSYDPIRRKEVYWTGDLTPTGKAAVTQDIYDAMHFDSARKAYEEAGQYDIMNYWKVGSRKLEWIH